MKMLPPFRGHLIAISIEQSAKLWLYLEQPLGQNEHYYDAPYHSHHYSTLLALSAYIQFVIAIIFLSPHMTLHRADYQYLLLLPLTFLHFL